MFEKINKALCTTFFAHSEFIADAGLRLLIKEIAVFVVPSVIQDDMRPFK